VYSRNIYNGHCMRQVALSTYTSLSLFFSGILGCSLSITQLYGGPLLVVWWQGQAARTTRNSSPRTFVERNVAKEPKSSQIAKLKFRTQLLLKRAKFLVFGSKRANLATLRTGHKSTAASVDCFLCIQTRTPSTNLRLLLYSEFF